MLSLLLTTSYTAQKIELPKSGRYILAQFDAEGVIVYQAYRPDIVPTETIYPGGDPEVATRLQLSIG